MLVGVCQIVMRDLCTFQNVTLILFWDDKTERHCYGVEDVFLLCKPALNSDPTEMMTGYETVSKACSTGYCLCHSFKQCFHAVVNKMLHNTACSLICIGT